MMGSVDNVLGRIKIGTDIQMIADVAKNIDNPRFVRHVYTEGEQKYADGRGAGRAQTYAGFYCAKEALAKATGRGMAGIKFNEISVGHDEHGAPYISLTGRAAGVYAGWSFALSISHSGEYATAVVAAANGRAAQDAAPPCLPPGITIRKRNPDSDKRDYGRLTIIAGALGYTGAPVFTASAAERSGAGLIFLYTPQPVYPVVAGKLNGPMVLPASACAQGRFDEGAIETILPSIDNATAITMGPGMGVTDGTRRLVRRVLEGAQAPVVLDADGINVLDGHIDILRQCTAPVVITPHAGEAMRLCGRAVPNDPAGRLAYAQRLSEECGCIAVLKGRGTVVARPGGLAYVNNTGNPGMARGGSGDILTGLLGGLLAQGYPPYDAAVLAVFVHGLAGDIAAAEYSQTAMTPDDMLRQLPRAIKLFME